ncbi:nicotinate-nucleotide--dimethylbenzimidazole phosphoribosyltransferase [Caloranaerobacter azorensis]|uniref:Nicotinate-nucleotide--dimethylbenzimidazole phosphoribosyltransferase n=3 Tax=Caloranaerobacter azorensis TaxID=116090 RepID=A0A1M5VBX6_9FIRM|nr:nicotinate-nucleotide--dimethylbenzimidazole phosphoribosyltransferase [Caloranaerobacter azorensis]KGG80425.1 nicotinate-nucleotide--dimethylbenzimidazole phosphoribosyltransferase [Caloranaerobacter azorensis H53214]QIB27007.1 nicotinate-nucleotide--dimethylbenzimidazole phosphoribosyltransferase [Caloranaerobacter azorensis]SHH72701.1 nicotinate-nucleotide-dimethylbenzimidazole phosphoribosyltransferase [Caloranaerobacter azorensis DSM 13643]
MDLLKQTISKIGELDKEAMAKAKERVDNLIKPPGSLGRLEEIVIQLAGITGELYPKVDKKVVIVMAADHGVFEEGVVVFPQEVTEIQTRNMARGVTGVCALAKQARADVVPVDIGVKVDIDEIGIISRKVKYGTDNMAKGPAMSREEAIKSLEVGIQVAEEQIKKGKNILATGEMGICNTTPSAAIVSVIGGYDPFEVTGIGANFPVERLEHKAGVVKRAIEINNPNPKDGIDVLAKVGGLEIGGMAGVMLAGAANRVPVVIDGFISLAAALIACTIEPKTKNFLIPSHASKEKGAVYAAEFLGLKPMLYMDMRLGEGTGAVLALNLIEAATYMNNEMITFAEAGIPV